MKNAFFFLLFSCFPLLVQAQLGGRTSFDFLNLPTHARTVALGGVNITSSDSLAVHTFTNNPALLSSTTDRFFSVAYHAYYAGIGNASLAYVHDFDKWGTWGFQMQYLSYGKIEGYDATGMPLGDFSARDYMIGISHAQQIGVYKLGATFKFAGSQIENFGAAGFFLDIGGTFEHPKQDLRFGLLFKNLGIGVSKFTSNSEFEMPFDLQLGFSFKPQKMPFRFSITAHNLTRNGIAFNDPNTPDKIDNNGNPLEEEIRGADKFSRHFVIGTEFLLNQNINLRLGYNFLTRKELAIPQRRALVGFSFGMMLRIKSFEFAYARSLQYVSGGVNNLTLKMDTRKLLRFKKIVN